MRIVVENDDGNTVELDEIYQDCITLSIMNNVAELEKGITFDKQELRDFIGALLHIQQKLNKGGRNE